MSRFSRLGIRMDMRNRTELNKAALDNSDFATAEQMDPICGGVERRKTLQHLSGELSFLDWR